MRRITIELDDETEARFKALGPWLEQHPTYGVAADSPLHLAPFTAIFTGVNGLEQMRVLGNDEADARH